VIEPAGAAWRLNLEAIDRDMPAILAFPAFAPGLVYDGPTLFVAGARSDYVRPDHEPAIRRLFPRARIARIAEAGHWVHAEQPEAFLGTLQPFLRA
jgi:pimeloyl-ACP methyl ester carboxylesterase